MKVVQDFFLWLSGAGPEELESCPSWEKRRYVAFGATVLVPSLFAAIAAAYALSTLTTDWRVITAVALVWAFIILSVDRALLASYRAFLPIHKKFTQFVLRFFVAALMGITIAHPVSLLIFRDTIYAEIEREREVELTATKEAYEAQRAPVREEITSLETKIAEERAAWEETFEAKFIVEAQLEGAEEGELDPNDPRVIQLKEEIAAARLPFEEKITAYQKTFEDDTSRSRKLQLELDFWQREFEREVNGQRSGLVGLGPRAKSIRDDQLAWRRDEAKRLAANLEFVGNEINTLRAQADGAERVLMEAFDLEMTEAERIRREEEQRVLALTRQVQQDQAAGFVEQQNLMRDAMSKQMDTRLAEMNALQAQLASITEDERKRVEELSNEPRRDILTQSLALHALFNRGDEAGEFALLAYGVLTLLFMLVDTMPLMVKFFTHPGPYDTLLHRDEVRFDKDRRSFIKNYSQYVDALNEGRLSTITQHKPLERTLIHGVERSRATVEFLDALFEMEQAFQRKLIEQQQQVEEGVPHSPEKVAMLEQMAATFYDDLRDRAEQFFKDETLEVSRAKS